MAVVPEGERLGQAAVHVDVAVAAGAAFAGDRIGKQRLPDPCSCEPVDRQRVLVLERHHGAASDLIRGVRAPQCAQFRGNVRVAPVELSLRRVDGGLKFGGWCSRHRLA